VQVPPSPSPLKFLVFMKIAGICPQISLGVGVRGKFVLTKELGGSFPGWTEAWEGDGRKIEIEQNLAQVEAPCEDGVASGCLLGGNSTPLPSRQSVGDGCGHE